MSELNVESTDGWTLADTAALVLRVVEDPHGVGHAIAALDVADLRRGMRDAVLLLGSAVEKTDRDRARVVAAMESVPPDTPDEQSAPFIARALLELWGEELNLSGSLRRLIELGTVPGPGHTAS